MNMDALWAGKKINGWYIGFKKVTMHVKKKKKPLEKKMLGKKIHSNIFYVLHNKDFEKNTVSLFWQFFS